MSGFKLLDYTSSRLRTRKSASGEHVSLDRATYVELFFDLVFIFCIKSILSIITHVEGTTVDWYSYYTFWFTFALMLQIWFNSTLFMNRFGTGRTADIVLLFTTMFLLFVMTQAISTSWDYYAIYNACWILIDINLIAHWIVRYRRIANPDKQVTRDMRDSMLTLGAQAALVLVSHVLPKDPAQIVCLVAMLLGFFYWYTGGKGELDAGNQRHLSERCALLMVLMFGETLIGFGNEITTRLDLLFPVTHFLLIVAMFLVYLNEIINLLDLESLHGGRLYMAISAWMTFCVANVTAGFEMTAKGMSLWALSGDLYFGISIVVFLLSFFLYAPFNKHKRLSRKWVAIRVVACLLVLTQASTTSYATQRVLAQTAFSDEAVSAVSSHISLALTIIALLAIFTVLIIDRYALMRDVE